MSKYEITHCNNIIDLENEAGLTTAQVIKNLKADTCLMMTYENKIYTHTIKWFLKNVLLFNNFNKPILK